MCSQIHSFWRVRRLHIHFKPPDGEALRGQIIYVGWEQAYHMEEMLSLVVEAVVIQTEGEENVHCCFFCSPAGAVIKKGKAWYSVASSAWPGSELQPLHLSKAWCRGSTRTGLLLTWIIAWPMEEVWVVLASSTSSVRRPHDQTLSMGKDWTD